VINLPEHRLALDRPLRPLLSTPRVDTQHLPEDIVPTDEVILQSTQQVQTNDTDENEGSEDIEVMDQSCVGAANMDQGR